MNQIKTTSWHWMYATRFSKISEYQGQISICSYFWNTVWGLLVTALALFTLPSIIVWGLVHLTSLIQFGQYAQPSVWIDTHSIFTFVSLIVGTLGFTLVWIVAGFFSAVFIIGGIVVGASEIYKKNDMNIAVSNNIFISYISAKKNKWCPMLSINNKDNDQNNFYS